MHAGRLVDRALADASLIDLLRRADAFDVLAAGKAAGVMLRAFVDGIEPLVAPAGRLREARSTSPFHETRSASLLRDGRPDVPLEGHPAAAARRGSTPVRSPRRLLGIGPTRPNDLPVGAEWIDAGHPLPNEGSVAGGRAALDLARHAGEHDVLVVLLSGGGSALMALPAEGITLGEKQQAARLLMQHGADIHELNTVRKHVSAIKGGQLAAACRGVVVTLAVSDVVGDDLSVIASGPTVPDPSTFAQALTIVDRRGGRAAYPASLIVHLEQGAAGQRAETPDSTDPRLQRSRARVIGPQRGAVEGARRAAASLGYHVHVVDAPVVGEARDAARQHVQALTGLIPALPRPLCVISSGETTVTVTGAGRGGRNQEFAFAMARELPQLGQAVAGASIGTDGIDGPTDAAGALVDPGTFDRAFAAGLRDPDVYLDGNNTYVFFDRLGDLIRTGPTSTNVGDLQVILIGE